MSRLNASPLGLTLDSLNQVTSGMPGYGDGTNIQSRFNHPNNNTISFTPWPTGPLQGDGSATRRSTIHSDRIYDSTLKNIIDISDETFVVQGKGSIKGTFYPTKLKAWDFAYLKNTGVFPNNRLMIARRFGGPVVNDPLRIAQNPISTLISWVPDGQDFISFSVGEDWEDAEASFTEIFNELGSDVSKAVLGGLGGAAGGGMGAVPLPGFTEIFQRKIMASLGLATPESGDIIPSGTPNLIKEAKRRKTISANDKGSTLKAHISIKMVCEWEQKFIAGIDPSIAWMDILNMVLRFGTSNSIFYLGETKAADKFKQFVEKMSNNPIGAINDLLKAIKDSIIPIIEEVKKALEGSKEKGNNVKAPNADDFLTKFQNLGSDALQGLAKKYKVRLIGVTNALTGAASTPWHITIGNPMRPIFCSGDMLVDEVTITLGPELAFNDLPSTIKAEFTLKNARNLGMQEILSRFNVGYLRTVKVKPDLYEANTDNDFLPPDNQNVTPKMGTQSVPITNIGGQSIQNTNYPTPSSSSNISTNEGPGTGLSGTGNSGQTRVGNTSGSSDVVNPDAHSSNIFSSNSNNP
jgi:hypothetical protein